MCFSNPFMLLLQMALNASVLRYSFPWNSRLSQFDSPPKLTLSAIEPHISCRHPGILICLLPWSCSSSFCPPSSFAQNGLPQILPFSLSKCLSSSREQPPIARPPIPLCPLFPSCLSQLHTGQFLDWFLPSAVLFQTDWKEICLPMELWFCSCFHFLNFYWNIVDL